MTEAGFPLVNRELHVALDGKMQCLQVLDLQVHYSIPRVPKEFPQPEKLQNARMIFIPGIITMIMTLVIMIVLSR